MKIKYILFLALCVSTLSSVAQTDTLLVHQLDSMVRVDQKWRGLLRQINNHEIDSLSAGEVKGHMRATDSLNNKTLKEIFHEHGFIGFNIAGKNGSHNFWLLIQHQDRDVNFQWNVLEKMKAEAERKNASFQDYAYLIDRVKVNNGLPQIYGTQMTLNAEKTSYITKHTIDPDNLDERRKAAGLPPIQFYISAMNDRYFGTIEQKNDR